MIECLEKTAKRQFEEGSLDQERTLRASNGTAVTLELINGAEQITVRSEAGQIIFEYQPETKKCYFSVPEGDLHFAAPAGNISLSAGRGIQLTCPGDIVIAGESKVSLRSGAVFHGDSSLVLDRQHARLQGGRVALNAEQGEFTMEKTLFRGNRLAAKIDHARVTLVDLEVVAETLRQKARDFFQNVEGLLQINSGRMRTFVQGLYNLKGERTYIKADKDMKLKGERIHLR
ncbi:MAG: hypothetical protein BWK76_01260 [Desulfobulbaceae bacterium A2]|nr:MAG: hypothetical protein BWK76_01260 [Desulfobulbaceae bacterium A2]